MFNPILQIFNIKILKKTKYSSQYLLSVVFHKSISFINLITHLLAPLTLKIDDIFLVIEWKI